MALARRAPLRLRVPAALRECLRASFAQRRSDAERKPAGLGSWTRDERRGACSVAPWLATSIWAYWAMYQRCSFQTRAV